jgi:arginyl-tRNA synthetase
MTSTYETLRERLQVAFDALEMGADPVLRTSERGDYQANGVMALAKRLSRPPREVAATIIESLDLADVATVEVAGPGFLNLTVTTEFLDRQLGELAADERLGVATAPNPKRVVIDYSAPNVAKEMHVGHLRSTVIGDALARIYRFAGHHVIARNHVGDWGTPFGMLIEHLVDLGEQAAASTIARRDRSSIRVTPSRDAAERASWPSKVATPRRCDSGTCWSISRSPTSARSTTSSTSP